MKHIRNTSADLEDLTTWTRYTSRLCKTCTATCCSLAVELRGEDLIRMKLVDAYEIEDNPKRVAKHLIKDGYIERYHARSGTFTLSRNADGDCIFLEPEERRCTIYDRRPDTCRNHPQIGPRPGFCCYRQKETPNSALVDKP